MKQTVAIIGGGLAGSEAALQLASRGISVDLYERRPNSSEPVHKTGLFAELVCSNSLKSTRKDSAAGMLKDELDVLGSFVYQSALCNAVDAGGALAVDRDAFAQDVTNAILQSESISVVHADVCALSPEGVVRYINDSGTQLESSPYQAIILATGPLTSDELASWLEQQTGSSNLAFYDAAAPIVMADSLDHSKVFRQSRYEETQAGDYLNAPFTREEYERFVEELTHAKRVIAREFETKELFQACQPIEEVARTGIDSLRFGTMKPVGLTDPATGKRPWAVLQLRAEDAWGQSYNLVGCQTNLTFSEQQRIFRMVPGLENAEFTRYGVMHRNTFVDAPHAMDKDQRLLSSLKGNVPIYLAGQISGTEGYCEAIRSGLQAALNCYGYLNEIELPPLPLYTAFGSLLAYATNPETQDYQPKHVNFGDQPPFETPIRNKRARYEAYAHRAHLALMQYRQELVDLNILESLNEPHDE